MKLRLPEKRWKRRLSVVVIVLLAIFASVFAYMEYTVYREVSTNLVIKNSVGVEKALVLYHPGLTTFSQDIAFGFADGLASNGWRVEMATASAEAPVNMSNYSLLVLDWPIYDFNPAPTISTHIKRIGDLHGIDTVILTIGGGLDPLNSQDAMKKSVENANGTVKEAITIFRGGGNYYERARQAAVDILP